MNNTAYKPLKKLLLMSLILIAGHAIGQSTQSDHVTQPVPANPQLMSNKAPQSTTADKPSQNAAYTTATTAGKSGKLTTAEQRKRSQVKTGTTTVKPGNSLTNSKPAAVVVNPESVKKERAIKESKATATNATPAGPYRSGKTALATAPAKKVEPAKTVKPVAVTTAPKPVTLSKEAQLKANIADLNAKIASRKGTPVEAKLVARRDGYQKELNQLNATKK